MKVRIISVVLGFCAAGCLKVRFLDVLKLFLNFVPNIFLNRFYMRQRWDMSSLPLFVLVVMLLVSACQDVLDLSLGRPEASELEVGIYAGGGAQTRTSMIPNGLSAEWEEGDEIAVWAVNSAGTYILSNHTFKAYGLDGGRGFFTSTLASSMPEDSYTYMCCYPVPLSVSGTNAVFNLAAGQDGKVTGGADIMVATPVEYGPLAPVPDPEDHSGLSVHMNRMMHQFRFFVPQDDQMLGKAQINKIKLTFPKDVVGDVQVDYTDPSVQAELTGQSTGDITMELADPISVSAADEYDYACLAIVPTTFASGEKVGVKAYTDDHILLFDDIDLCARTFAAGHSTPVKLKIREKMDYYKVRFTVSANNLGENPTSITLTAPSGCKWGDTGTNVYTYSPGGEIPVGTVFEFRYEDGNSYKTLSRKGVTVSFDSEHAVTTQQITMPDMSSGSAVYQSLTIPYLLYQDFNASLATKSNDDYTPDSSNITNTDGIMLDNYGLAGWNASRFKMAGGNSIRIGVRYQSGAWIVGRYCGRLDTPALTALKAGAGASIKVTFDYGCYIPDKGYDGTETKWEGWRPVTSTKYFNDSQNSVLTCEVGYHNEAGGKALSGDNQSDIGDRFTKVQSFGPHKSELGNSDFGAIFPHLGASFIVDDADATTRVCWWALTSQETSSMARNCHYYIYIDNIKIQIAN